MVRPVCQLLVQLNEEECHKHEFSSQMDERIYLTLYSQITFTSLHLIIYNSFHPNGHPLVIFLSSQLEHSPHLANDSDTRDKGGVRDLCNISRNRA